MNSVIVKTRRLGGGFGGKEGIFTYSCIAALACQKLGKPISCMLDSSDDMMYSGKRHEAFLEGDMYLNKDTLKIAFMDIKAYIDGGYASDLSPSVLERLLYHLDNAYKYGASRFVGKVCKTNGRSNTAFRGFGAP